MNACVARACAVARVRRLVVHLTCRLVLAWLDITCGIGAIRSCVTKCAFAFVQVLLDTLAGHHAHSAILARFALELIANVRELAIVSVMKLVTNTTVRSFGVYAVTTARARNDEVIFHVSTFVNVLCAV